MSDDVQAELDAFVSEALALGEGATAAVEALAETLCYLDTHRHTAETPACAAGRRKADGILVALDVGRAHGTLRGETVARWLDRQPVPATVPSAVVATNMDAEFGAAAKMIAALRPLPQDSRITALAIASKAVIEHDLRIRLLDAPAPRPSQPTGERER